MAQQQPQPPPRRPPARRPRLPSPEPLEYFIVFTSTNGIGRPVGVRMQCKSLGAPKIVLTAADFSLKTSRYDQTHNILFHLSATNRAAASIMFYQDGFLMRTGDDEVST